MPAENGLIDNDGVVVKVNTQISSLSYQSIEV